MGFPENVSRVVCAMRSHRASFAGALRNGAQIAAMAAKRIHPDRHYFFSGTGS
jgi:hypothetical protein